MQSRHMTQMTSMRLPLLMMAQALLCNTIKNIPNVADTHTQG